MGNKDHRVSKTCSAELKITQDPAEKSRVFRVDVGLDKEKLQRGIFAGTVRIRTDDNDFPELKIPVKGLVM
jgi:hypothetical protein